MKGIIMANRKIRFNFIDLLILAVIALAVLLLLYVFVWSGRGTQTTETQTATIEYVIEIQKIDETLKNAVEKNQPVEDAVERKNIGTVKSTDAKTTQEINFNYTTGKEEYSEVEGKINLYVTIAAEAVETESSFTVNGYEVCVGKLMSVILPDFQGYGYCIELTKLS